ncbi:hypothetical protein HNQ77_002120 [Silvibacterium bohemicum]|uniref:Uncharacterized protein n=1 Tax=Silvibacterium bohemicum TaxID=1577686 RepID=A0A841K0J2_9BACT|nr:hypothetical protein [Silvibacterium bohemicum]MBB6144168.1 hypothetical protein [Silvibacterium bohemicum]
MSDLEAANFPIAGSMLNDLSITLDNEMQRKVFEWAIKTTMVLHGNKFAAGVS